MFEAWLSAAVVSAQSGSESMVLALAVGDWVSRGGQKDLGFETGLVFAQSFG